MTLQSIISYLHGQILLQRKQAFLWTPVPMGIGIVTWFAFEPQISVVTWLIGSIIMFLCAVICRKYYQETGKLTGLWIFVLSIALMLFLCGLTVAQYRFQSLSTPLLDKNLPVISVTADIDKIAPLGDGTAKRIVLNHVRIQDEKFKNIRLHKLRLKSYHFKENIWKNGDHIQVKVKLRPPGAPVMPGGYDFRSKAYYSGISATGYTIADAKMLRPAGHLSISGIIQTIREVIGRRLYDVLQQETAGIGQALLTGERNGITFDDTENLRASGLAHLLAISGLHIGLVAGCVFFFIRLGLVLIPGFALHYPIKKWAAAVAIIVALSYMLLAGATVPTVRAFIMTSLVLLAIILDRSAMNLRLVALAAILVMVTTPEALLGPSFQLSFAAVAALIAFYQGFGRNFIVEHWNRGFGWRIILYLLGIIITTIIATLATAPFSILFFNRVAVYGVLANILAMPVMAFVVMPFGLLATLVMPLGFDKALWQIMGLGIEGVKVIAHSVAHMDHAILYWPSLTLAAAIFVVCGFIWMILWKGHLRIIGVIFIILGFIISAQKPIRHIFISDDMSSMLFVDKSVDKLVSIGHVGTFTKKNWIGFLGYSQDVDILNGEYVDNIDNFGGCDALSCRFKINDFNISVLLNPLAVDHLCSTSDILIAKIPLRYGHTSCRAEKIIDRFDIKRWGATRIDFYQGKDYEIHNVNDK